MHRRPSASAAISGLAPLGLALLGSALLGSALSGAPLAAQQPRDLSLQLCFALDQFLVPDDVEPHGWFDAERFLTFEEIQEGGVAVETWVLRSAADPRQAELFLPADHRQRFTALPGLRAELVAAALASAEDYVWDAEHRGFVAAIAEDLYWYDRAEHRVRRLTHTPGPEIGTDVSPDGSMVAYVHDGDLFVVPVAGGEPRPLTEGGSDELLYGRLDWVYQEEVWGRGNFKGFWWSPDSTRVALLKIDESPVAELVIPSDRPGREVAERVRYPLAGDANPAVGLGIADVAGGAVRWVDMGEWVKADPLIVRVNWHPSGREVFYQVQDREQRWLRMLAVDAETGGYRQVFLEESPCWVEPGVDPVWIADGAEFLWQSERDGYEHVYRYRVDGELLGRLTEGPYDADQIAHVDEAGGVMFFLADKGDPKQQRLFRVGLAGGEVTQVSQEDGWHDVDFAPDGSKYLCEYSTIERKLQRTVRAADGSRLARIVESNDRILATLGLEAPEFVTYAARDGYELRGMLIRPRDFDPAKRYPTVMHTYAGPKAPRVLNRWKWRDQLWHQRMAQRGYLVFVTDPRSASGQGRVSACEAWRRLGQTELRDLEDGVDWLVAQGLADPERVGIWGWSYGGYQTLYCMTRSKKWAAGVAVNPVTDWRFYDTIYTERYMGMPQDNVAGYAAGSVLEVAGDLHGALLLAHSTMDDNVHMRNSMEFIWRLQQAGKSFRFLPYPRVRHGIEDFAQQLHLFAEIEAHFDAALGGGAAR